MVIGSKVNLLRFWRKELIKKGKGSCGDGLILGSSVVGIWVLVLGIG